jgi:hypothetical protein
MIISVKARNVQLGLGLIGIGKPWGVVPNAVPSESEAMALLEFALRVRNPLLRHCAIVWERIERGAPRAFSEIARSGGTGRDHGGDQIRRALECSGERAVRGPSFEALSRSLEASIARLGPFHVLQLHKTTPRALASEAVQHAWDYAESLGIHQLGPSVSDLESARIAIANPRHTMMQMPFNASNRLLAPALDEAAARGMWVAINRPFAMGALAQIAPPPTASFWSITSRA